MRLNTITEILIRFVNAQNGRKVASWDMFGHGWSNTLNGEGIARHRLMMNGFDAFDANLLMEEALFEANAGRMIYVGSHRAAGATWQAGMSTATDEVARPMVNAIYA